MRAGKRAFTASRLSRAMGIRLEDLQVGDKVRRHARDRWKTITHIGVWVSPTGRHAGLPTSIWHHNESRLKGAKRTRVNAPWSERGTWTYIDFKPTLQVIKKDPHNLKELIEQIVEDLS